MGASVNLAAAAAVGAAGAVVAVAATAGAVVAAGAVVTKDVSEFTIVGGVPAKEIGQRENKNPNYKLGRAAWFR